MVTPRSSQVSPRRKKKAAARDDPWERVKHAFERDWLQAREEPHVAEASAEGPPSATDSKVDWFNAEPAVRYGFSAFESYGADYPQWNDELDQRLARGWNDKVTGRAYEELRHEIRVGWHCRH